MNQNDASLPLVVHIIDALPAHGAERLLVDVVKNFSPAFRHEVLCLEKGGQLSLELEAAGIPVTSFGYQGVFDLGILVRLYRWFKAHRPIAVHTHLFTADFWGRLAARIAGVPGIFSTSHSVNSWKHWVHHMLDRLLARASTRIVACSPEIANVLRERDGIAEEKIIVIANGIDMTRLTRAGSLDLEGTFGIAEPRPVILALIGRLHPVKGHLDLLPSIADLKKMSLSFHLLMVGEGEQREEIEQTIIEYDLSSHVTLTGYREDISAILAATDILLIPSRWEGLPITLLEGMAMGCAVLATAVGGIPDVVEEGKNGYLVAAGDMVSFKGKLQNMIEDKSIRVNLAENARSTILAHYSVELVCKKYESLYREIPTCADTKRGGGNEK